VDSAERDEELVARTVAGDRDAFAALVQRHERRVYNLTLRMMDNDQDARDAAQEAFLTAFRKLSSYRGEAAFTTWMHRVTLNACHDLMRKRGRAPLLALDPNVEPPAPPAPDHAETSAGAIDVRRALAEIPEDFRAVLVLHDVQDLAYEQIAQALDLPLGTVKSRLHRGRVALARIMTGEPARERGSAGGTSEER